MARSDADLLAACQRGDRAAFGALVERYQGVVCAVSYSRTRNRALSEDVAQDTFLAAWRQLGQLRDVHRLQAWLCGIARNLARKASRRAAREAPLGDNARERSGGADPFDHVARAETQRVVRDALGRVPDSHRDVLVLYYRDQRSIRDVAAALGLSEAAALQRLARGRQYLADSVTDLVERSLRGHRPRPGLAALVVAALPALAASPADAASVPPGGLGAPWKLAVAAAVLAAAGITAYVVLAGAPAALSPAAVPARPAPPPEAGAAPVPRSRSGGVARPPGSPPPQAHAGLAGAAGPGSALDAAARAWLHQGPARGPDDAPVTIAVFTDFLCDHCGNAVGALDQLGDEYPGKLRIVVKLLPVRPGAAVAAEAALAADEQGMFWQLYDLMFAHQDDLSRDRILALAEQAGLDVPALRAALDDHRFAAAVKADRARAFALGVHAVPTAIINGTQVTGLHTVAEVRRAIDRALATVP